MNTEIEVIGGTDKMVRCNLKINGHSAGELQIQREEFTKFSDLLFGKAYTVVGSILEKKV